MIFTMCLMIFLIFTVIYNKNTLITFRCLKKSSLHMMIC